MGTYARASADFVDGVVRDGVVWAIRDADGFPTAVSEPGGRSAMPFWSSRSRVLRVARSVDAYVGCVPEGVPLDEWRARWLPGLRRDGLRVGVNWSGPRATGFDMEPEDVEIALRAAARRLAPAVSSGGAGGGSRCPTTGDAG